MDLLRDRHKYVAQFGPVKISGPDTKVAVSLHKV